MKSEKKLFTGAISFFLFSILVLAYLYFQDFLTYKTFYAFLTAASLTGLNFAGAIYSIKISLKRDSKSALNTYLIGMGIRIPIFLTVLIISMLFLDISHNSLIFSVLIFYIYFLIMEIIFLNITKK